MGLGALSDGLASTPPMGWNSWNRFGPFVSDQLVRETADALIESGMRAAGYRYVVTDDAWEGSLRADDGNLEPNLWRFPNMRALAAYLHERDPVLARSKRLHDAVDPITGQTEDDANAPVDESIDHHICRCV